MISRLSRIVQLGDAPQIEFDPENPDHENAERRNLLDGAGAREHYLEVGPSSLRKLRDSASDPKYDGTKTTRRQLMEDGGSSEEFWESEHSYEEGRESDGAGVGQAGKTKGKLPFEGEGKVDSKQSKGQQLEGSSAAAHESEDLDVTFSLHKTREADKRKGAAVSCQNVIWGELLDARIQLQKMTIAANKLPLALDDYRDEECLAAMNTMLREAALLSEEILELRELLLNVNDILAPPPRKRRRLAEEALSTDELGTTLKGMTQASSALDHRTHLHTLQTLNKWSAKVQAVAPSALLPSNRNAFLKNDQHLKSVVQLIDENLLDQSKLLSRTRIRRSKGGRLGATTPEDPDVQLEDEEIFDDIDFYQQLLRDVIDSRGNSTSSGANDWMTAQKQKKAKKKVDTKASKGRKLRYEVHEKIQKFMVPIPVVGAWHEEQVDDLFASLLGKGVGAHVVNEVAVTEVQQALQGGFRVFG